MEHDNITTLPQNDPQKNIRQQLLDKAKDLYQIDSSSEEMPVKVHKLPPEEEFSTDYYVHFFPKAVLFFFGWIWQHFNLVKKIHRIDQVTTIYKKRGYPVPKYVHFIPKAVLLFFGWIWQHFNLVKKIHRIDQVTTIYKKRGYPVPKYAIAFWKEDWFFGHQRLAGACPHLIRLCTQIPDRLAVQESHLTPFLETSLDQALEDKKLFYCDLGVLENIKDRKGHQACAPILLLYRNNSDQLLPVAIQLFQEPGPDNPVFLPSDDRYVWLLAKMWYNQAEATYHQSVAHLGITHLLMEGVDLSTHRHLSQYHPIYKLLAPHLFYTMAINQKGRELLLDGGAFDVLMSVGVKGAEHLMAKSLTTWRLDVDGTLPEDLKRRGVYDDGVLLNYHYRDDGLKVYEAIKTYVTKYVHLYYENGPALLSDWEIQAWANELVKSKKDGGIGMNGVPGGGRFHKLDQLIQTLTSFIFTCSAQHAAVNFPQYNFSGFPPAYPTNLTGPPPTDKKTQTMDDVLDALPDVDTLSEIIFVANLLSTKMTNALGDFETIYIQDHKAVQILQEFRMELSEIAQSFTAGNKQCRVPPYDFLLPENIPNSVSI